MSLQVWLPLNGDLHNQGLTPVTVANTNTTVDNSGKIGKCYSFNGSSSYLFGSASGLNNSTTEYSYACWLKLNNTSHTGCLFSNRTVVNTTGFTIFYASGQFYFDDGDRWTFAPASALVANTWYHICFTWKKNVGIKYYCNGVLKNSTTTTHTPTTVATQFTIGKSQDSATTVSSSGGTPLNSYLNDVRIYDHALSPKEVEEIAKGLVLHYKLDGETQVMVPSGYQQLEYIESTGTSYTDTGYKFNAETDSCKVIMKGNDTNNNGMIFASSSTPYFWLYYYKGANTIGLWVDSGSGQKSVSGVAVDTNKHTLEYKNHQYYIDGVKKGTLAGTHTTTSNNIYLFSYSASTNYPFKGRIYYVDIYRNGIAQRLYVPAKKLSDNTIGLYDVINKTFIQSTSGTAFTAGPNAPVSGPVYDSSGYSNNGTIVGSLTAAASSPRYDVATVFNGSSYTTDTTTLSLSSATQLTVSCWAKPTEANLNNLFGLSYTGYYWQFVSGTNSSLEIRDSSTGLTGSRKSYAWPAVTAGQWVHIVCTYNAGTVKIYKNGELYSTNTTGGTKLNDSINMFDVGNSQSTRFNGQISDFRIYTTALTDGTNNTLDQVKELYTTSMSIDSSGNIHVRELSEL